MPLYPSGIVKLEGAPEDRDLQVGEQALDFERTDVDGGRVRLSQFAGRPVALLCLSSIANSLSREKLIRFASQVPALQAAGYQPVVVSDVYWERARDIILDEDNPIEGINFPVLDDESHSEEALNTYYQRDGRNIWYPLILLDGNHVIQKIQPSDDLLDDTKLNNLVGSQPGTVPQPTPGFVTGGPATIQAAQQLTPNNQPI